MGSSGGWFQRFQDKRRQAAATRELIEQVVGDFDPIVRAARSYRKRLEAPIERAWAYASELVDTIVGPFELSPARWSRDPLIQALFVDEAAVGTALQNAADLGCFIDKQRTDAVFGLLTATRREKTIFVAAMENGIVKRDVPQTAVEFRDVRIVVPTQTEAQHRRALKLEALNILATRARKAILDLQSWKQDLVEQRSLLATQRRMIHSRKRNRDSVRSQADADPVRESDVCQIIDEIEMKLREIGEELGSPEDYLRYLVRNLENPETILSIETLTLRLNWMGIKVKPNSAETWNSVTFTEIDIKDRLKRVAVKVRVAADDLKTP